MIWVPVESKLLLSVAHDPTKHILYLRFRSGDVYPYFDFPNDTYQLIKRPVLPDQHSQLSPLRAPGQTPGSLTASTRLSPYAYHEFELDTLIMKSSLSCPDRRAQSQPPL